MYLQPFLSLTSLSAIFRPLWTGNQHFARPLLNTQDNTDTEYSQTDIYAFSGIRTHDPGF
jgi:hypothetical protein